MSIAFESNTSNRIDRSEYVHGMSFKAIYDSQDSGRFSGDRRLSTPAVVKQPAEEDDSTSSSSIGRNSDTTEGSSAGDGDAGDGEVQSSLKGGLNSLDSLEEVLPIKRGISTFYNGKSKSFTSLADASSCSSIKDIAKKDDPYTRKRKNLLAHSNLWDKNRIRAGGLYKRFANSSRSSLSLAAMLGCSENNNNGESSNSNSSSPSLCLPPLPPQGRKSRSPDNELSTSPPTPPTPTRNFSTWRSFSLSDLQRATPTTPWPSSTFATDHRSVGSELHTSNPSFFVDS